jgi:hypothetical protein
MAAGMSEPDGGPSTSIRSPDAPDVAQPEESGSDSIAPQQYGTIVVVGGGCYGSYYVRQLGRGRLASALDWRRLIVVDRDPMCRVATELRDHAPEITIRPWDDFFADYLAKAAVNPNASAGDAIVPSPLMPHLLFDWLVARARERYPARRVEVRPLRTAPQVPWQRPSPNGATHYVSFAEWMCPVNCIEPQRCPKTRGPRHWTMPAALHAHVETERAAGHFLEGPIVFHCVHRAYGVGMIDVKDVVAADAQLAAIADGRPAEFLVGTVSHCHGALGVLSIGR